jgi:hypothetical protein
VSMLGFDHVPLGAAERIVVVNPALLERLHLVIGITCLRNESLILRDTLDHVSNFADVIIAYDDASTDGTRNILRNHPKVAIIIENNHWVEQSQDRLVEGTKHRGLLLETVRRQMQCEWIYCFDADERIVGDLRDFLSHVNVNECNGIRVRRFDAYLTPDDQMPVKECEQLLNRRRSFGPEYRAILMLWRNSPQVKFCDSDTRQPKGIEPVVIHFHCQSYGKAISVEQWEKTSDLAGNFPYDTHGYKSEKRKGQAIRTFSDFGRPLFEWGPALFAAGTQLSSTLYETTFESTDCTSNRLSVLLATNYMCGWTGSETLVLTLIKGLHKHGCKLTLYARHLDRSWAAELCGPEVVLTDDIEVLRIRHFDLAHVQHNTCLMDVRATFPTLPVVFSSLGVLPFLEQPAPFDCGIARYLAISEEVRDNLIAQGIPVDQIQIMRNLVSEWDFVPAEPVRPKLERILVISNKLDDARKIILLAAARKVNASIRFIGGCHGTIPQDQLTDAINAADVVVSLGRGVVEAMLCGRVPLVYDIHGGDGLVTPDRLDDLKTCNFSGRRFGREFSINDLIDEFAKYKPEYGERLRALALTNFGYKVNLPLLLGIYSDAVKKKPVINPEKQKLIAFFSNQAAVEHKRTRQLQVDYHHSLSTSQALSVEIHRIKRSVSWRLTKPLRGLWNLLR